MERGVTVTTMHGDILHIVSPVLINGVTLYSSDVEYSMAGDLSSQGVLLERFLIVGVVAIVLAALILWAFSQRLLSRPLHAITGAANDIAGGNLQVGLAGLDRRRDEIGMLARSFVRMARQLNEMIAGISQTSEELGQAFQALVKSGDSTARGALHVSDVMDHMGREMRDQVADTDALSDLVGRLRETLESLTAVWAVPIEDEAEDAKVRQDVEQLNRQVTELAHAARTIREQANELQNGFKAVVGTANGQLGRVQEANHSIARLKELSSELQKLTSVFDMM